MIVGLYGVSLCLLTPSVLCIGGFGELGDISVPAPKYLWDNFVAANHSAQPDNVISKLGLRTSLTGRPNIIFAK